MSYVIYKYTCPENKSYIGLTNQPKVRKTQHKYYSKRYKYPFYIAINKYGFENIKYEEIDIAFDLKEANEKEIFWIKFYKTMTTGYNLTPGGYSGGQKRIPDYKIKQIIEQLNQGVSVRLISQRTRVSKQQIFKIKQGKTSHNNTRITVPKKKRKKLTKTKDISPETIEYIIESLKNQIDIKIISKNSKVKIYFIREIKYGRTDYHKGVVKLNGKRKYIYKENFIKSSAKLNRDNVLQIRMLYDQGLSIKKISLDLDIPYATTYAVAKRTRYNHIK